MGAIAREVGERNVWMYGREHMREIGRKGALATNRDYRRLPGGKMVLREE
jgi:general stress protein YciG